MPSKRLREGDEVFVRGLVLAAASDAIQVRIENGEWFGVTIWLPASECAKREDIGDLKPIRRASKYHIDR